MVRISCPLFSRGQLFGIPLCLCSCILFILWHDKKLKEQIGGIGLSNIKKRLELNYGEGNFDFKNFKEKNKYIAELKVKLKTW